MLNYIDNDKFCESIKEYLCKFQHTTADTNDLQKVFEETSGKGIVVLLVLHKS